MDLSSLLARIYDATDSASSSLLHTPPPLVLVAISVLLSLFVFIPLLRYEAEGPVHYAVEEPEQSRPGWQGEVLANPTIHVDGSSAIRCYCPATGQLLGLVNPATKDGIDRAVARARDAQPKWAATSFAQRRRLLRTILK
jgi:Aldehyde dehydrogenase family